MTKLGLKEWQRQQELTYMTGNPTETQQMVADIPREEDVLQEPEEPTEEEPEEEQGKEDSQEGAS